MNLINKAIEHYILHELLTLKNEERRLSAALAKADTIASDRIVAALAGLQKRADSLDEMLVYLEPVSDTTTLPALAA